MAFEDDVSEVSAALMKHGGPAYPYEGALPSGGTFHSPGMTLRDYFAAQALYTVSQKTHGYDPGWLAGAAYAVADAMLAERSK